MLEPKKTEYYQLAAGFEFPPQSYVIDSAMVTAYLEAVKEPGDIYQKEGLVPPMAITTFAMSALSQAIVMPPGTIHVSQEFDFLQLV